MMTAAKKEMPLPGAWGFLRVLLLLVVTLCLPETRVWGFAATPQPVSGVFESASPLSIGENTIGIAYDASGYAVAPGSAGGGLNVTRFDYPNMRPRQGGLLKGDNLAHPGATDEIMVLGRRDDTAGYIGKEGHNVLNTKIWDIHVNDGWVMRGISEGRTFKLATDPSFSSLRRAEFLADGTYIRDTTVFFRELKMLRDAGYVRKGNLMVPGGQ